MSVPSPRSLLVASTALVAMTTGLSPRPIPQDPAAQDPQPIDFGAQVEPLLRRYCFGCHGDDKQKGDMQLNVLDPAMTGRADAEAWDLVRDVLEASEMPPDDEPQPTDDERRRLLHWLRPALQQAAARHDAAGRAVLRRLTREQYAHSLQDLLGVSIDFGRTLPADGKAKNGFHNNGEVLQSSALHLDLYQQLARQGLSQAIVHQRPEVVRYRVTFGRGIGKGKVAGRTGGYQSVPLATDDFTVELLDHDGQPTVAADDAAREAHERIQRKISVGLRGSGQDRFRVVDEGMVLLSALPHREVVPKSWQGPSPNLKLEMQRVWPREGDFVMRVRASRGYVPPLRKQLLVSLDEGSEALARTERGRLEAPDGAIVLAASTSDQRKNLREHQGGLLPIDVPEPAKARLRFELPSDGFYQIDLVHAPVAADAMPSVRLRCFGHHIDQRPVFTAQQLARPAVVTPLGAIGVRRGNHSIEVGGPFFVGFTHVVITPLPADHALVRRLSAAHEQQEAAVAHLQPSIRALIGTRTDDGMDYTTFGEPVEVTAPLGAAQTYSFYGRLENLPIPAPESGDKEILSGFLLLGLWNDHLVKSAQQTGPPLLVESIEFEAPYLPEWPPRSHTEIFFDRPTGADDDTYTRAVLERFVTRAFRRPARADEVARYLDFYREIRDDHERYEHAVQEVLVAILCSPEFLYLCEPVDELVGDSDGAEADDCAIPQWMLMNRLAYFLWDSPPDDQLRRLSAEGRLERDLLAQVDRLLDDPRSARFLRSFTHDWLRLDRHDDMAINVDVHRDYTRFVKRDMREEVYAFVRHVFAHDLPLDTFVRADFAMLNQNLAEFYGVEGRDGKVTGPHLRPVQIAADHPERRCGLLSHGAFYTGHSDGTEPHPIKRAVWLKARLLGDEPPPPPPNVPDLDPDTPGFDKMTLKQRIESHRDKDSCRDCHAGIDPYGFVFERMSAVGRFQPERKGGPVDATSTLPDGTAVDGLLGIQRWLVEQQRDALARALLEHLFGYALGRELSFADDDEVEAMLQQVRVAGYRARAVIRAIVSSPSFRSK